MANVIIKDKTMMGKTRSEQEAQLRKEWGATMTDAQLDKLKYLERKNKDRYGSTRNFIGGHELDRVK